MLNDNESELSYGLNISEKKALNLNVNMGIKAFRSSPKMFLNF